MLNGISSADDLIQKKYPIGSQLNLTFKNGKFRLKPLKKDYNKGDLVPVRFVKAINGYGITV